MPFQPVKPQPGYSSHRLCFGAWLVPHHDSAVFEFEAELTSEAFALGDFVQPLWDEEARLLKIVRVEKREAREEPTTRVLFSRIGETSLRVRWSRQFILPMVPALSSGRPVKLDVKDYGPGFVVVEIPESLPGGDA